MVKIYLFCLLLLNITSAFSSDTYRTIKWFSQPSPEGHKVACDFEGSIIVDGSSLPHWFESFEVGSSQVNVVIKDAVFELVPDSLPGVSGIENDELIYTSEIGKSAGQNFLRLTVFPFVKRNGHIERLLSFSYSISENSNHLKSATSSYEWKASSVLSSGKWTKISTKSRGIYKITYDQLQQWGFQNPDQVSMHGNGGLMLPVMNKDNKFDDLSLYPVWKGKDNAGKNCLFFFSSGNIQYKEDARTGKISHQQNPYSTETYFYLTDLANTLLINKANAIQSNADSEVITFPNYSFYEKEAINLIKSGRLWYGEHFIAGSSQNVVLTLDNPDPSVQGLFKVSAVGKSSSLSTMDIAMNGTVQKSITFFSTDVSLSDKYADDKSIEFLSNIESPRIQLKLT